SGHRMVEPAVIRHWRFGWDAAVVDVVAGADDRDGGPDADAEAAGCGGGVYAPDAPSTTGWPTSSYSTGTRSGCSARNALYAYAYADWTLGPPSPSSMPRWIMYSTRYER